VRKKLGLTLAVTGIAVLLLLPQAAAQASPAPTPSARPSAATITLPAGVAFNPKAAKCTTAKTATGTIKNCIQSQRLPLKELTTAQRAQRKSMMAQHAALAQRKAAASATPAASAATSLTPPSGCAFTNNQTFTYTAHPDRFTSCVDGLWTVIDWEVVDGAISPVGIFEYEDQGWITYSATSTSWTHSMNTYAYAGGGTLSGGLSGTLSSNCFISAACIAESTTGVFDPQSVTLTPGGSYSYQWNEQDAGPATTTAGAVDTLDSDLGVTWDINDGTTPDINTETGLAGRCDDAEQTDDGDPGDDSSDPPTITGPGCVDEGDIPTLYLSVQRLGSAAIMVDFAQYELSSHWGSQEEGGQPLNYIADQGQQYANRGFVCYDGTFTNLGTAIGGDDGSTDSCDEFPFAATKQSAGFSGNYSGADCAQVTAVEIPNPVGVLATDWSGIEPTGTVTGSEPCVRGHVPLALNSLEGTDFRTFRSKNRLVNLDPFWVEVTPLSRACRYRRYRRYLRGHTHMVPEVRCSQEE
jgi:hypothetical protein